MATSTVNFHPPSSAAGRFRHAFRAMRAVGFTLLLGCSPAPVAGQDMPPEHQHDMMTMAAPPPGWTWSFDAAGFWGYNDQRRRFTDFYAWESQNWLMAAADRPVGPGRLAVTGMASLEPFTLQKIGSPQAFQTGETYNGRPLIDYQHPHDLVMALGARYTVAAAPVGYYLEADLVGAPALGPTAFMHRASARDNPQAPLAHHNLDSTHVTPGVLSAGLTAGAFMLEGSVFRGEEPDEDRVALDQPRLNSWSMRASWRRGPLTAQFSGGRLHQPESWDLHDLTRLTASLEYSAPVAGRPLAATLAWGQNREFHGALDAWLAEWDLGVSARGTTYGRAEWVAKDILHVGPDPIDFFEPHPVSRIGALTLGYVHELAVTRGGRLGLGADVTVYRVPENLAESYGSPHSFHVFLRLRRDQATSAHAAHGMH